MTVQEWNHLARVIRVERTRLEDRQALEKTPPEMDITIDLLISLENIAGVMGGGR